MPTQQIIIFDGPDMCGKSNIAKELSNQLSIPYFKASSEHDTFLKHQDRFLNQLIYADPRVLDILKQTGHSVIFDRAYPSEWAYSALLQRKTDWGMLCALDDGYAQLSAKLIICVRKSYEGITDDIQPKFGSDVLQEQDRLYREFADWTKLTTLVLDTSSEDIVAQTLAIRTWLSHPNAGRWSAI